MDVETATIDRIEQQLLEREYVIARARAEQMVLLREVDRRQGATVAGCRSLVEWVAGRLDVAPETARDLVATAHRLEDLPDVEDAVASGEGIEPTTGIPPRVTSWRRCRRGSNSSATHQQPHPTELCSAAEPPLGANIR